MGTAQAEHVDGGCVAIERPRCHYASLAAEVISATPQRATSSSAHALLERMIDLKASKRRALSVISISHSALRSLMSPTS